MKVFADTFYFLALLNWKDAAHARALAISNQQIQLVTSEWVLLEVADAMASRDKRQQFVTFNHAIRSEPGVTLIVVESRSLAKGMAIYAARPDKEWSLTDCISFNLMRELEITDALTGDHHFEQAGFRALLREE